MTGAIRLVLATATTAALILIAPVPAGACSCVFQTLDEQVAAASAVFLGTVASSADGSSTLDVTRLFKGSAPRRATVERGDPSSSCAVPFVAGRTYVVFATSQGTASSTDICSGTTDDLSVVERLSTTVSPSPDLAAPSLPPTRAAASRSVPIAVAASLATLIAAWGVSARRHLGRPRSSGARSPRPAGSHR